MRGKLRLGGAPLAATLLLGAACLLALLVAGGVGVAAQGKDVGGNGGGGEKEKGGGKPVLPYSPQASQIIEGFPLTITVEDDLQMDIRYRNREEYQFYSAIAEGVFLWVKQGDQTKVFGPQPIPAGRTVNTYAPVSNTRTGAGTPADPWKIETVVNVPGSNLRLTQRATYVNGAEFVSLDFTLLNFGASEAMTATLFHAADLFTFGSDAGVGFYDAATGGVGDVVTRTNGTTLYQQFVPRVPASRYMEGYYNDIWSAIGDTGGPGPGFNNTVVANNQHDAGVGLQWNLTLQPNSSLTVGDTDLFSPHASLCGSFSDVAEGNFAYNHIYHLACLGVVGGYADTTFRPNYAVTRGQLSKIVANSAGFNEPVTAITFEDVPAESPFYGAVERMANRGLIGGYPCGGPGEPCNAVNKPYFRPNADASRGQITKIVSNAKGYNDNPTGQTFQDVPAANTFYLYVERLASRGIMTGYPCGSVGEPCMAGNKPYFRWGSIATRAQTSKITANVFFPGCCGSLR